MCQQQQQLLDTRELCASRRKLVKRVRGNLDDDHHPNRIYGYIPD
jgi:hypothetical protein